MKILRFLIIIIVGCVILIGRQVDVACGQFYFLTPEQIGKPAPDFKLKNLEGKEVSLSQIRGTGRAVVFFWATWCPHCRRELKELYDKREELAKKNIKLAILDLGESPMVVKRYLEKQKIQDLEVLLDFKQEYGEKYGVVGLPTYFFVDEQGIIRDMQHGLPEDLEKSFSQE